MSFDGEAVRVEADPRARGRIYWMFETGETRPFGHLEVAAPEPTRWTVKVVLARTDLVPEDVLPIVARSLVLVMSCEAEVVEVFVDQTKTTHTLVNVGSRFV